jgi:CubicO group peptidase (beta-lactamase class C family)
VGLVIGHLLCDGKISSLDDTIGKYSNGLASSVYKDVTIKNLLRMASGVNENRDNEQGFNQTLRNRFQDGSNDQLQVIQSVKIKYSDQGKDSRYHTLDVTAASVLVNEITGKSVDAIFYDKIYSQIGPEDKMVWWADKNGNSLGMAGLNMTTRDWARLGQYMVDEIQADSCIGKYLKDGLDNAIKTTARDYQKYGYFFWVSKIGGKQVIVLTGKGGQVMIPNHYNNSVAVVISASNFKYKKKDLLKEVMPSVTKKFGKMGF